MPLGCLLSAKKFRRLFFRAYVDSKKAFDSVHWALGASGCIRGFPNKILQVICAL